MEKRALKITIYQVLVFLMLIIASGVSVGAEGLAQESTNPLMKVLQSSKPTSGMTNQLETTLDDGTKVIFRRGSKTRCFG